jgi:hypothetical protein
MQWEVAIAVILAIGLGIGIKNTIVRRIKRGNQAQERRN